MDAAALKARCASRFRDENHNIVTAVEWLAYLNDAYTDIVAASPFWTFLETRSEAAVTVLANTRSIPLPADVTRVTAVRNVTNAGKLDQIDGRVGQLMFDPEQDDTGIPYLYRLQGVNIEVYPRPTANTVLALEYPLPPPLLVEDTDTPVFPYQFHPALVEGALEKAYTDDGAADQAALHATALATILGRMEVNLLGPNRQERAAGIVDSWWD